jgi:hypothetical protein
MATLKDFDQQTLDNIDNLADQCAEIIKQEARRLLTTGAVDPNENKDRPMWTPKLVVSVACEHAAKQWTNHLDKNWMRSRNNLRNF